MGFALELSGRTAPVTGGSRGIGRAIALALARCAAVAVIFRTRREEADAVVDRIRSDGGQAIAVRPACPWARTSPPSWERVARDMGPVDILVNNAGIALEDAGEESFDPTLATNLKSAYLCTEPVPPGMRARSWGRNVNISSVAAARRGRRRRRLQRVDGRARRFDSRIRVEARER